jgi:hypothetical protein
LHETELVKGLKIGLLFIIYCLRFRVHYLWFMVLLTHAAFFTQRRGDAEKYLCLRKNGTAHFPPCVGMACMPIRTRLGALHATHIRRAQVRLTRIIQHSSFLILNLIHHSPPPFGIWDLNIWNFCISMNLEFLNIYFAPWEKTG